MSAILLIPSRPTSFDEVLKLSDLENDLAITKELEEEGKVYLDSKGYETILVARREDRLLKLKKEIFKNQM